ncbi:hypothetical protein NEOKW01_0636 [Nematocida sp. AWRm80]|nr:hypothetical protein NEOKW01_0636 [Nematocida sp. AWRm80]
MFTIKLITVDQGNVLNLTDTRTGNQLLIGGFEGLQRISSIYKIKWNKASMAVVSNVYEGIAILSPILTQAMHNQKTNIQILSEKHVITALNTIKTALAPKLQINTCLYGDWGPSQIQTHKIHCLSLCIINLPETKGSFLPEAAKKDNLTIENIIQLHKYGSITVNNQIKTLQMYSTPSIVLPKILIVSITDISTNYHNNNSITLIKQIVSDKKGVIVIIRAAAELTNTRKRRNKAITTVSYFIKEITKSKEIHNDQVYLFTVLEGETKPIKVEEYCRIVFNKEKNIIRPVYKEHSQTAFAMLEQESTILLDSDTITISKNGTISVKRDNSQETESILHKTIEEDRVSIESNRETDSSSEHQIERELIMRSIVPWVLFLGTSAAVPTPIRNVSSILVTSFGYLNLLDCGEETVRQIMKLSLENRLIFDSIQSIALSHKHADHVLGLFSLLKRCNIMHNYNVVVLGDKSLLPPIQELNLSCIFIENNPEITVNITRLLKHKTFSATDTYSITENDIIIPKSTEKGYSSKHILISWKTQQKHIHIDHKCINIYNTNNHIANDSSTYSIEHGIHYINQREDIVSNGCNCTQNNCFWANSLKENNITADLTGNKSIFKSTIAAQTVFSICPAIHVNNSYSIRMDTLVPNTKVNTHSLSYTGDTRPNSDFINLSEKVDLMIHEATFEDSDYNSAIITNHSTVSEAKVVFNQSTAKELILTHFSSRYKAVNTENTKVAIDFMGFPVNNVPSQTTLLDKLQEWANISSSE